MKTLTGVRLILDPAWTLSWGVDRAGAGRWVLAAHHGTKGSMVLWAGNQRPGFLPAWFPVAAHTSLGETPVMFLSEALRGTAPDSWVDSHEPRLIPRGFTSDLVATEWAVHDDTIHAATVRRDALREVVDRLAAANLSAACLSPPLWDLASLYGKRIDEKTFVLWHILEKCSVLGLVVCGRLRGLSNLWPGIQDLKSDPATASEILSNVAKALVGDTGAQTMVVSGASGDVWSNVAVEGFQLRAAPDIDGVAAELHEAFACACHTETHLDFAPPADARFAKQVRTRRVRSLTILRTAAVVAVCIAALMALAGAGIAGGRALIDRRIAPLHDEMTALKKAESRVGDLRKALSRKSAFAGKESGVTVFLNAFQEVLPEGAWVEQVSVSESAEGSYEVVLMVLSYSTSHIPDVLDRLGQLSGAENVHMEYSEQTTEGKGKRGKKVIRIRIALQWNQ